MKMKIILLLVVVLVISLSSITYASDILVNVNGDQLSFDVPPTIIEGRTVLPVRAIFESLGLEVGWDDQTKTVTGKNNSTVISLIIDNKTAYVNGIATTLDVPATIIGGRTLVPARFVAEATGAEVNWDGITKTVYVNMEMEQTSGNKAFSGNKIIEVDGGEIVDEFKNINPDEVNKEMGLTEPVKETPEPTKPVVGEPEFPLVNPGSIPSGAELTESIIEPGKGEYFTYSYSKKLSSGVSISKVFIADSKIHGTYLNMSGKDLDGNNFTMKYNIDNDSTHFLYGIPNLSKADIVELVKIAEQFASAFGR